MFEEKLARLYWETNKIHDKNMKFSIKDLFNKCD